MSGFITLRKDPTYEVWYASDGENEESSSYPDYAIEYLTGVDLEYPGVSVDEVVRLYREMTGDYVAVLR